MQDPINLKIIVENGNVSYVFADTDISIEVEIIDHDANYLSTEKREAEFFELNNSLNCVYGD